LFPHLPWVLSAPTRNKVLAKRAIPD
jgi:hypothetical protein